MIHEEIYAVLNEIFCDVLDDSSIELKAETSASEIPEWDSFSHINLIVAIELHFGLKFSSYEVERLENVGGMVELIATKLKG
ncbi:acyl carrier protein [Magnetovibrio sp. PR-2]|uniref:acyl carrier protein n=1 Tax=Magnetovibrio sp. PR-2 TaxID=3120356 RepID=UPI002FCE133A